GHLVRPSVCTACGAVTKIEAHHPDYSKALVVDWLCRDCHRKVHRVARAGGGRTLTRPVFVDGKFDIFYHFFFLFGSSFFAAALVGSSLSFFAAFPSVLNSEVSCRIVTGFSSTFSSTSGGGAFGSLIVSTTCSGSSQTFMSP